MSEIGGETFLFGQRPCVCYLNNQSLSLQRSSCLICSILSTSAPEPLISHRVLLLGIIRYVYVASTIFTAVCSLIHINTAFLNQTHDIESLYVIAYFLYTSILQIY